MIKTFCYLLFMIVANFAMGQYPAAAGHAGTSAIYKDSSIIMNWATEVINFSPGPENISDTQSPTASFGTPSNGLGQAEGNSFDVVSLGDGGSITLGFQYPILNGIGPDFAIFENSFTDSYLEFAFVEVSTNGVDFVRFQATSNIQTTSQTGPFDNSDPTLVNNLAGKYRQGYGTPFDLTELIDSLKINVDSINFIRLVDVVGSTNSLYGSFDSSGNIINDPFPSAFNSSGFDLDGIAIIHQNNLLEVKNQELSAIEIYPNPTVSYFRVKSKLNSSTFKLYNLHGQMVLEGLCNELKDSRALPNGTYIVFVSDGSSIETSRLVVLH